MARARVPLLIYGTDGAPANAVSVTIVDQVDSALATIYSGKTGSASLANPVTTDSRGRVPGYLLTGSYAATISGPAGTTTTPEEFEIVSAADNVPVGTLHPFDGNPADIKAPWVLCDGGELDGAANPRLAARWGTGSSSRHGAAATGKVRLPNLTDRTVFAAGGGLSVGQKGGQSQVTLTAAQLAKHKHTITDPGHTHFYAHITYPAPGIEAGTAGSFFGGVPDVVSTSATGITLNDAGNDQPHENMPPFLAVEGFIVKAG